MAEQRHVYEVVEILDDGKVVHLRCPKCGKEIVRTRSSPDGSSSAGYKVVRDERGELLQGDFNARHSWSMNMELSEPEIQLGP